MNNYLIPANSKKGQLMFSIFRPIDLGVLIASAFISVMLMFIIEGEAFGILVIKLLPLALGVLLVVPIPYYHNVLVFIEEAIIYLMEQKQYSWKGRCARSEFGSEQREKGPGF